MASQDKAELFLYSLLIIFVVFLETKFVIIEAKATPKNSTMPKQNEETTHPSYKNCFKITD